MLLGFGVSVASTSYLRRLPLQTELSTKSPGRWRISMSSLNSTAVSGEARDNYRYHCWDPSWLLGSSKQSYQATNCSCRSCGRLYFFCFYESLKARSTQGGAFPHLTKGCPVSRAHRQMNAQMCVCLRVSNVRMSKCAACHMSERQGQILTRHS